jgi:hypothetical protein
VISEAEALDWNPRAVPQDPRPLGRVFNPLDGHRVTAKANETLVPWADWWALYDQETIELPEFIAICGSHRLTRRGEPLLELMTPLSEHGKLFDEAVAAYVEKVGPGWRSDDKDFPCWRHFAEGRV